MSNNSNDILPAGGYNNSADREKMLADLNNEINFGDDAFETDAAEGLEHIPGNNVSQIVNKINRDLQKQIGKKKRKKRVLPDQSGVYVTIIIILILLVVAFIIIRKVL